MADDIRVYASTDTNAPTLSGTAGDLITVLTKCLVDGYTTVSVTSITRSGTTATVTVSGGHGLVTGQYATIAGAAESDYNITAQVTVSSSTEFTYTVANSPTTPATGTITACRASAGWNLEYSGTNKAVYRSLNNASQRHCFRVLDAGGTAGGAKEAVIRGYVSMSDVDTGSEDFPTTAQATNGLYIPKSAAANGTTRTWIVWADDKTAYMFIANGTSWFFFGFGHCNTLKSGDAYNSFVAGSTTANTQSGTSNGHGLMNGQGLAISSVSSSGRVYMPRATSQSGTSVICFTYGQGASSTTGSATHGSGTSNASSASLSFAGPSANADGGTYVVPIYIMEFVSTGLHFPRALLPGLYAPMHPYGTITYATTTTGVVGLSGRTLYHQYVDGVNTSGSAQAGIVSLDQTGPW